MDSFLGLVLLILGLNFNPTLVSSYETCRWDFKPNPSNCNSYFQCNFGQPLLRNCPAGLHWNSAANTCDWARNAGCETLYQLGHWQNNHLGEERELDPQCGQNALGFVPHPDDCGKYFVCNHGTLLEMSCTSPLQWNANANTCDWPANAGCQSGSKPPGITGTVVGPPAPPPEEIGIEQPTTPRPTGLPTTSEEPDWATPPPNTDKPTPPTTSRPKPSASTTYKPSGSTIVGIITGPSNDDDGTTTAPVVISSTPPSNDDDVENVKPNDQGYKVICYFTGWAWYRPAEGKYMPSDVNPDLCTHIIYAFALLDSNTWTLRPADTWADLDNKFYEQITGFKSHGRKVTIAVGGWTDSAGQKYSLMLRDVTKLTKFIASVVEFVKKYNFDGVDLDYEYPGCPNGECNDDFESDKNGFIVLVKGLREALPAGSILSAAVSCNKKIIDKGYDVPTLSKYLDWIGVMVYDIHGAWEGETGHIAPLYPHPSDKVEYLNINYAINYWISKGASPSKLIMGIPFYGQSFSLANSNKTGLVAPTAGPGQSGKATRQPGVLAYYEICSADWDLEVQDEEGRMGPYVVKGNQWVSFDDVPFVIKKMTYIKNRGLGGAMVWALDFDDFKNRCGKGRYPLLSAISTSLIPRKSSTRFSRTSF